MAKTHDRTNKKAADFGDVCALFGIVYFGPCWKRSVGVHNQLWQTSPAIPRARFQATILTRIGEFPPLKAFY
jgi:hypothetical protein